MQIVELNFFHQKDGSNNLDLQHFNKDTDPTICLLQCMNRHSGPIFTPLALKGDFR